MSTPLARSPRDLAAALERGEIVYFPEAPFALPTGEDRAFLLRQRLASFGHKNVAYNPHSGRVTGYVRRREPNQKHRLASCLSAFSKVVGTWLAGLLPFYRDGLMADMVSLRPEEEATRRLRTTARNDLIHLDAFPSRPTRGDRILRVFANINPTDPRVWVTSDPFKVVLERHGKAAGLPGQVARSWWDWMEHVLFRLVKPGRGERSPYDSFMLRLHDYLKHNDSYQEQCAKTVWHFQPGSAWVVMTDACTHAVLRGRYALEHSFFVGRSVLVLRDEAPCELLERHCTGGTVPLARAA